MDSKVRLLNNLTAIEVPEIRPILNCLTPNSASSFKSNVKFDFNTVFWEDENIVSEFFKIFLRVRSSLLVTH